MSMLPYEISVREQAGDFFLANEYHFHTKTYSFDHFDIYHSVPRILRPFPVRCTWASKNWGRFSAGETKNKTKLFSFWKKTYPPLYALYFGPRSTSVRFSETAVECHRIGIIVDVTHSRFAGLLEVYFEAVLFAPWIVFLCLGRRESALP